MNLEEGKVYILELNNIQSWGVQKFFDIDEETLKKSDIDKAYVNNCLKNGIELEAICFLDLFRFATKEDSPLYAVKYIGDGIFEEMLTGEKIYDVNTVPTYLKIGAELVQKKSMINQPINREDLPVILFRLGDIKTFCTESNIYTDFNGSRLFNFEGGNDIFQRYLKETDEIRIKRIEAIKQRSEAYRRTVISAVDAVFDNNMMFAEEHLENQLSDPERKPR